MQTDCFVIFGDLVLTLDERKWGDGARRARTSGESVDDGLPVQTHFGEGDVLEPSDVVGGAEQKGLERNVNGFHVG